MSTPKKLTKSSPTRSAYFHQVATDLVVMMDQLDELDGTDRFNSIDDFDKNIRTAINALREAAVDLAFEYFWIKSQGE